MKLCIQSMRLNLIRLPAVGGYKVIIIFSFSMVVIICVRNSQNKLLFLFRQNIKVYLATSSISLRV